MLENGQRKGGTTCYYIGINYIYKEDFAEYCFVKNPDNSKSLHLQPQNDSLECDGSIDVEREDTFNLQGNLVASYKDYYSRDCLGFGSSISCFLPDSSHPFIYHTSDSYKEFPAVKCPVKDKVVPVYFPDKFSILEADLEKSVNNFQMKNIFSKEFQVKWKIKAVCPPRNDIIYSGSYFIRITGECKNGMMTTRIISRMRE